MSIRQDVTKNIVETLQQADPQPAFVSVEPFEVDKIAITQFPALLITPTNEDRQTITMGAPGKGIRSGTITYTIRGYVRGKELDKARNELIEAIEVALESDRYRDGLTNGVKDSQVTQIEIVDRLPPLAEIVVTLVVDYTYRRQTL